MKAKEMAAWAGGQGGPSPRPERQINGHLGSHPSQISPSDLSEVKAAALSHSTKRRPL